MSNLPPLEEGVPIAGVWGQGTDGHQGPLFQFHQSFVNRSGQKTEARNV